MQSYEISKDSLWQKVQKKINFSSLRLINCQTLKLGRTQSIQSRIGLKRKMVKK